MENKKDYVIGLDIGNASIGYACIDLDNKLLRYKSQHMWGTRLFNEPKYEIERAYYRGLRRTYVRRRERLDLLNDLFYDEIKKIDENFFIRLKESFRVSDKIDKETGKSNMYILFDGEMTDKDYYKQYPTIYHLRKALMSNKEKFDIRLVYLAIHHIYKYRGNFLYSGEINGEKTFENVLTDLFNNLRTTDSILMDLDIKNVINVLNDKSIPGYINYSTNGQYVQTKDEVLTSLYIDRKSRDIIKNVIKAILGYKFSLSELMDIYLPNNEKINFEDYNNNVDYYNEYIGNKIHIFTKLYQAYCIYTFSEFIGGDKYVSDAMIRRYDKHKYDLSILKKLVKIMDQTFIENNEQKNMYKYKMFKEIVHGNYVTYIKNRKSKNNNGKFYTKATKIEFYKFVKSFIKDVENCVEKDYILDEIQKGTFMPRIHDYEKSVLPSQFNLIELKMILKNQMKYYPFLKENYDKLLSIFTFVRPCYVGVLSTTSPRSWSYDENGKALYATDQKLYPWNFMDLIDKEKIAENFMKSRIHHCKYVPNELVLPKSSIIYQAFVTLSALSHIKIYGEPLDLNIRNLLFYDLFCKNKVVTKNMICKYLKNVDAKFKNIKSIDITGLFENKIDFGMCSLIDMKKIFNKSYDINNIEKYDEIITYLCVFYDIDIKKDKILSTLNVSKQQLHNLLKLNYSGWAIYSKKFLVNLFNSEGNSIMDLLLNAKDSNNKCILFSEIINNRKYGFNLILTNLDNRDLKEKIADYLKEKCYSNSTGTSINQAIKLVNEIVEFVGYAPKHIYVESNEPVDVTINVDRRFDKIVKLYEKIENEPFFNQRLWPELLSYRYQQDKLNNDTLYLYFLQLGKCMYSGEDLNINNLLGCQIDHIIPRLFVVNDSLDNKVLVKSLENQLKSGNLIVDSEIINKRKGLWKMLYDYNFISEIKYNALIRKKIIDNHFNNFISKQFTENCKIVESVKNILNMKFGKNCVVGINSGVIHKFRMEQMINGYPGFAKIRNLNDMHHAKDAYLTAAIGTYVSFRVTPLFMNNNEQTYENDCVTNKTINKNDKNFWLIENKDQLINWLDRDNGCDYIKNIFKTMKYNDCQVSKKIIDQKNGSFYNDTMYPKSDVNKLIPLRNVKDKNGNNVPLNPMLYGGYQGESYGYALIIQCEKPVKRKVRTCIIIENIPIRIIAKEKDDPEVVMHYLQSLYKNPIIIAKIRKNELVNYKGQNTYFISCHELQNAKQLIVNSKFDLLLYFATNSGPYNDELNNLYDTIKESTLPEEFIEEYIDKIKKHFPLYMNIANRIEKFYLSNEEYSFKNLNYEQKLNYISQLLLITKTGASRVDFTKEYGGGNSLGRLHFNYPIKTEYLKIINTSRTGLQKKIKQFSGDGDLF